MIKQLDGLEPTGIGKWFNRRHAQMLWDVCNSPKNVLELGPGRGAFLEICREHNCCYEAVEPEERFAVAIEKQGYKVYRKILPPLPRTNLKYDVIVACNVIEHFKDIDDVLSVVKGAYSKLKKGGRIVISVPDYLNMKQYYWLNSTDHRFICTVPRMKKILKSAGCDSIRFYYTCSYAKGFTAWVISKIVAHIPIGELFCYWPDSRILERLHKLQSCSLRSILIWGTKNQRKTK